MLYISTPCGSPEKGISARRPARGRGDRTGLCTSVTASRMTDAYGASTPAGVQSAVGQVGQVGQVGSFAQIH